MANRKVNLKIRVTLPNGKRKYCDPAYNGNHTLRRGYALIDGEPVEHKEGVYTLVYYEGRRLRQESIKDRESALIMAALDIKETELKGVALGLIETESALAGKRRLLQAAIDKYLEENEPKAEGTYGAYTNMLAEFTISCKKKFLEDIDRADWLAFIKFLKAEGHARRTVSNKIGYLTTFFINYGLAVPLQKNDRALFKYTEKKAKAYNERDLIAFFSKLSVDENDLFQVFLCTGFRDAEVGNTYYTDIDFEERGISVTEKLGLKFKPKDSEERTVPIPPHLVELLRARTKRYPDTRLVFPAKKGSVDTHFLRKIKDIAFKNGLNCGHCITQVKKRKIRKGGKVIGVRESGGLSCKDHPVCEKWQLHRFRKTFATLSHQNGASVRDIQKWLGHADLDTTLHYLADVDDQGEKTQAIIGSTFEFLNGIGLRKPAGLAGVPAAAEYRTDESLLALIQEANAILEARRIKPS